MLDDLGLKCLQGKFAGLLARKSVGLVRTERWIDSLVEGLMVEEEEGGQRPDKQDALELLCSMKGLPFKCLCDELLTQGLIGLVARGEEEGTEGLPETVEWLDSLMIQTLRLEFNHVVKSAVILSWLQDAIRERLGRESDLVLNRALASLGRAVDKAPVVAAADLNWQSVKSIVRSVCAALPAEGFSTQGWDRQEEEKEKLVASWTSSLASLTHSDNACYKKMVGPFKRMWMHISMHVNKPADISASAKAAFLRDTGLYGEEVSKLLLEQTTALGVWLRRVALLNRKIHFSRYKRMFAKSAKDRMKTLKKETEKQMKMPKKNK